MDRSSASLCADLARSLASLNRDLAVLRLDADDVYWILYDEAAAALPQAAGARRSDARPETRDLLHEAVRLVLL